MLAEAILVLVIGNGNAIQIPMDTMKECKIALVNNVEQSKDPDSRFSKCIDTETGKIVTYGNIQFKSKYRK